MTFLFLFLFLFNESRYKVQYDKLGVQAQVVAQVADPFTITDQAIV